MSILHHADAEVAAIATHAARLSTDQLRALRDRIVAEIESLEASIARRQRAFPMQAHDFDIQRDQARCVQRRREVAYLNRVLATPPTQGNVMSGSAA
ncbi:MAG: hypothetical protein WCB10_12075 [Steroidobacteraceae bacterium]